MLQLNLNSKSIARFLSLYGVYLAIAILGRLLEDSIEHSGLSLTDGSRDPSMVQIFAVTFVSFAWALVSSSFTLTILARHGLGITSELSIGRTVELISIETIRSIAATLIRLPLLILPGLFEWIRLSPVPFVVILDKAYQHGHRDALEAARRLYSTHPFRITLLLLPMITVFLLEFGLEAAPSDALPLWNAPLQHAWSLFGFSALHLATDLFVLFQIQRTIQTALLTPQARSGSNEE